MLKIVFCLSDPENPLTTKSPELDEVQEKFNPIKNSLDKIILPSSLRLHDLRTGTMVMQKLLSLIGFYASLFNCTMAVRASDPMTASS